MAIMPRSICRRSAWASVKMEFRNIVISNPARLSLRHGQLCIVREQEILIPLEDICSLMLESRQALISSAALEALF